jgi:hypothetical protein
VHRGKVSISPWGLTASKGTEGGWGETSCAYEYIVDSDGTDANNARNEARAHGGGRKHADGAAATAQRINASCETACARLCCILAHSAATTTPMSPSVVPRGQGVAGGGGLDGRGGLGEGGGGGLGDGGLGGLGDGGGGGLGDGGGGGIGDGGGLTERGGGDGTARSARRLCDSCDSVDSSSCARQGGAVATTSTISRSQAADAFGRLVDIITVDLDRCTGADVVVCVCGEDGRA